MYQKILVPLDGSELAECVLPHLETIAKGCGVEEITFVLVLEPFYMPGGAEGGVVFTDDEVKKINARRKEELGDYLNQIASRLDYNAGKVKSEVITSRATAESLAEYATKNEVDLIILATHGRSGISRWAWGSVADRLLRSACVPVLMVRAPGCVPGI